MDWSKIIEELQHVGLTQKEIAKHCGCSQGLISQIKTGILIKVSYDVGNALKQLHQKVILK